LCNSTKKQVGIRKILTCFFLYGKIKSGKYFLKICDKIDLFCDCISEGILKNFKLSQKPYYLSLISFRGEKYDIIKKDNRKGGNVYEKINVNHPRPRLCFGCIEHACAADFGKI
jgi:hypothetical protein